jgi:hypothetical protein
MQIFNAHNPNSSPKQQKGDTVSQVIGLIISSAETKRGPTDAAADNNDFSLRRQILGLLVETPIHISPRDPVGVQGKCVGLPFDENNETKGLLEQICSACLAKPECRADELATTEFLGEIDGIRGDATQKDRRAALGALNGLCGTEPESINRNQIAGKVRVLQVFLNPDANFPKTRQ